MTCQYSAPWCHSAWLYPGSTLNPELIPTCEADSVLSSPLALNGSLTPYCLQDELGRPLTIVKVLTQLFSLISQLLSSPTSHHPAI